MLNGPREKRDWGAAGTEEQKGPRERCRPTNLSWRRTAPVLRRCATPLISPQLDIHPQAKTHLGEVGLDDLSTHWSRSSFFTGLLSFIHSFISANTNKPPTPTTRNGLRSDLARHGSRRRRWHHVRLCPVAALWPVPRRSLPRRRQLLPDDDQHDQLLPRCSRVLPDPRGQQPGPLRRRRRVLPQRAGHVQAGGRHLPPWPAVLAHVSAHRRRHSSAHSPGVPGQRAEGSGGLLPACLWHVAVLPRRARVLPDRDQCGRALRRRERMLPQRGRRVQPGRHGLSRWSPVRPCLRLMRPSSEIATRPSLACGPSATCPCKMLMPSSHPTPLLHSICCFLHDH
ncbi:uncharacterized protein ACA1_351780 [Acanthamoeba castellanii str. Neff]|uniref:Uncharacterized protein n=1 Tax=Acanthamoeba castellanii (strain ATCC 30010 / Neff) TaxID=1257118 RepID=L8GDB0_ACACF|nr:uncharacterized protein ACA1_351780 [Acanthamoeba castellanii str. Neff]ELR11110.1 hypothetical protein ACA1_351780 [Acanthamoeba castellanii str. Neff]